MSIPLTLSFKGYRTYVHGTDQFDELLYHASARLTYPLRIRFRRFCHNQPDLHIQQAPPPKDPAVVTTFRSPTYAGYLTESDRPVTSRYPYDEEAVVNNSSYTSIEILIARVKAAHPAPPIGYQWAWVGIDLSRKLPLIPETITPHDLGGARITRSRIATADLVEEYGTVLFALAPVQPKHA